MARQMRHFNNGSVEADTTQPQRDPAGREERGEISLAAL